MFIEWVLCISAFMSRFMSSSAYIRRNSNTVHSPTFFKLLFRSRVWVPRGRLTQLLQTYCLCSRMRPLLYNNVNYRIEAVSFFLFYTDRYIACSSIFTRPRYHIEGYDMSAPEPAPHLPPLNLFLQTELTLPLVTLSIAIRGLLYLVP